MIFDREVLKSECIEDLCQFGIENDGIKSMVFTGDALQFSMETLSQLSQQLTGLAFKKCVNCLYKV